MTGKRLTTEEFINKCYLIHKKKYDYSLVNYYNSHTKVKIICPVHGEFEQTPNGHLNGCGCRKCANELVSKKLSFTKEVFIDNAVKIHGNKYDYSLVEYHNKTKKVKIICPVHGEFEQSPDSHINQKSGCPLCGFVSIKLKNSKTLESFISRAIIKHGLVYDYSLVDYIGTENKIMIICKKHGAFVQKPYKHLQGQGCPMCNESRMEKEIRRMLIENEINFISQYSKKDGGWWLLNQSLDFLLIDYNVAIECQGEQHFFPVDFGNKGSEFSNVAYEKIVKMDKKKYKLCVKNNIELIYYTNKIDCLNNGYWSTIFTDKEELLDYIKKMQF